jgi:hypothetical protein
MVDALITSAIHAQGERSIDELVELHERYSELQRSLDIAKKYYGKILVELNARGGGDNQRAEQLAQDAITSLAPLVRRLGTFRLQEHLLRFREWLSRARFDYEGVLDAAIAIEALLERYPLFATKVRKGYLVDEKIHALIRLNRLGEIGALLQEADRSFITGTVAWFSHQDHRFAYLLHTRKFEEAMQLVGRIENCNGFAGLSELTRDAWRINRLLAELLTGRPLSAKFDIRKAKPGDITRSLLAEFPSFKDDYTGHYFTAILIEVLLCLESSHGQMYLIDRVESLLKYRQRHLKDRTDSQAYRFIEMLRLMIKHDFNPETFLTEVEPLHQQLLNPIPNDPTRNELVLPYEVLWDEVVKRLPNVPWLRD